MSLSVIAENHLAEELGDDMSEAISANESVEEVDASASYGSIRPQLARTATCGGLSVDALSEEQVQDIA